MPKSKPYSLEIIRDNRPSGFVEYVIKTPNPQTTILGKSRDIPEVFQTKMKKTLARLNYEMCHVWAISLAAARTNGKRAIAASLSARRLTKALK